MEFFTSPTPPRAPSRRAESFLPKGSPGRTANRYRKVNAESHKCPSRILDQQFIAEGQRPSA